MCPAFGSVTSAHTYLPPFFLLFNHVLNDHKLSETCSYLFLSLQCQQLSLLATACPFLSPGSPSCGCCFIPPPPWETRVLPASQDCLCQLFSSSPISGTVPGISLPSILPSGGCLAGLPWGPCSSPASLGWVLQHKIIP